MSNIEISIPKDYARLIKRVMENYQSSDVRELRKIGDIVSQLENEINRQWNPERDQKAKCKCSHIYERHFDSWEDMRPVGCKYCECGEFK